MKNINKNKIIKWLWIICLFPPISLIILIFLVWMFADIPSFEELENPDSKLATQIISEDGKVLTTFHIENRSYTSYDELSPYLIEAVIATEDLRFREHSGIDFQSLARVLFKTILLNDSSQGGGSTISQQLAKTLYPRNDISSSIPGVSIIKMLIIKMKEWITAVKLEKDYSKDELIDMYLNAVFFGSGAYGINTAAQTYFDKTPKELNIQESATLIGIVNKPTRYNPILNPTKSLSRRNFVLGQMEKAGYITETQKDSLVKLPIDVKYTNLDHNSGSAPYFRDMLRRYMNEKEPNPQNYTHIQDYRADSLLWVNDGLYGWLNKNKKPDGSQYNLDKDGLKIYTTINSKMQQYAEEAVEEHLKSLQKTFDNEKKSKINPPFSNDITEGTRNRILNQAMKWSDRYREMKKNGVSENDIKKSFNTPTKMRLFAWNDKYYIDRTMTPMDSIKYYKSILRAGIMAIEPNTGEIKAYVGGPNYRYFKYDNIMQSKRQVGSTIKPFLYTLAMQEGMTPCYKLANVPQTIMIGNTPWTPKTTDKKEWIGQIVTLKWGLSHSSNYVSAFLMKQYGPQAMVQMMRKMGIKTYIDQVPSICVGSPEISLYDMIVAYNVYPSKGVYIEPIMVKRIEDSKGNVISEFSKKTTEAINENIANIMADMMQGVINKGSGQRLRFRYNLKGQIAGKTGTTNDHADGWFIAYTPQITAGVWVGAEDKQVHFQSLALGQGANMALPIWAIFYQKLLKDKNLHIDENHQFASPVGVETNCDENTNEKNDDNQSYFD